MLLTTSTAPALFSGRSRSKLMVQGLIGQIIARTKKHLVSGWDDMNEPPPRGVQGSM